MNKLLYKLKKLGLTQKISFKVDCSCKLCQQSLKNFEKSPLTKNDVVIIIPNINYHGKITSYHIGRAKQSNISETKIYKDLKVDKNDL